MAGQDTNQMASNPLEALIQMLSQQAGPRGATVMGRVVPQGREPRIADLLKQQPQESPDAEGMSGLGMMAAGGIVGKPLAKKGSSALQSLYDRILAAEEQGASHATKQPILSKDQFMHSLMMDLGETANTTASLGNFRRLQSPATYRLNPSTPNSSTFKLTRVTTPIDPELTLGIFDELQKTGMTNPKQLSTMLYPSESHNYGQMAENLVSPEGLNRMLKVLERYKIKFGKD